MASVRRNLLGRGVVPTLCGELTRQPAHPEQAAHDVASPAELDSDWRRFSTAMPVVIERCEVSPGHWAHGVPVSPRIAARARERYKVTSAKDDKFDALVRANTPIWAHERWRSLTEPSPLLAEIEALTRD